MAQNPTLNVLTNLGFKQTGQSVYSKIKLLVDESQLPKVYFGLDMGETTGVAVWFPTSSKLNSYSFTFIEFLIYFFNTILEQTNKYNVIVVIEDVAANSPVFKAQEVYNSTKGEFKNKLGAVCKLAERVGAVKEKTKTIISLCEQYHIRVIPKRPTKASMTKLKHEEFVKITGFANRLNEHQRDSVMILWNIIKHRIE